MCMVIGQTLACKVLFPVEFTLNCVLYTHNSIQNLSLVPDWIGQKTSRYWLEVYPQRSVHGIHRWEGVWGSSEMWKENLDTKSCNKNASELKKEVPCRNSFCDVRPRTTFLNISPKRKKKERWLDLFPPQSPMLFLRKCELFFTKNMMVLVAKSTGTRTWQK